MSLCSKKSKFPLTPNRFGFFFLMNQAALWPGMEQPFCRPSLVLGPFLHLRDSFFSPFPLQGSDFGKRNCAGILSFLQI